MDSYFVETQGRDVLRIGDLISLKLPKSDGWLCADGLLDQVYGIKNPEYVEDILWEVYVQNQYNCAKDYKETTSAGHVGKGDPALAGVLLEQLRHAEANEMLLNKKLMAMKIGKPVAFGDVIQLKHMKSKKMLTILDTVLAKSERENMRIVLNKDGDSLSWLELIPRHKYDHEGQLITNNAELYIRVRERPGEYVHSAKKFLVTDQHREINSSLDSTCWMMYIYQHAPGSSSKDLMAGQLISLQEIEMSSYITLDHCSPGITQEAAVVVSPMIQLSNVAADCNIGTGMLWMVENKDIFYGGPLRTGKYSLRHFNSGLFMKFENDFVNAVPERSDATYFEFVLSQISEVGSTLQEGCSVQLSHQGRWLSMHRSGSDRKCIPNKDKTQALSLILSAKTYRMFETELFLSLECCRRLRIFEELVDDNSWPGVVPAEHMLKTVFSVLQALSAFLTREKLGDVKSNEAMAESLLRLSKTGGEALAVRQTMIKEQGILDALMDLLQSSENDAFAGLGTATALVGSPMRLMSKRYSAKGASGLAVSTSVKDLNNDGISPDITPSMITPRTPEMMSRKSLSSKLSMKAPFGDNSKKKQAADDICHEILDTLFYCLLHNHENKMYIADRFPVLLKQIKGQQAAVLCVKEILRNNLQLLQTKVREREMAIFLDLVITTEMNPVLLSLLQATCSCPQGVDSTQRMVVLALYKNELPTSDLRNLDSVDIEEEGPDDFKDRSLVIDITLDQMIVKKATWNESAVYMQPASAGSAAVKEILGYELVEKGLPRIQLTWEQDTRRDDFSVQNLFNYPRKVPLEIICNVLDSGMGNSRRSSIDSGGGSTKLRSSMKRRMSVQRRLSIGDGRGARAHLSKLRSTSSIGGGDNDTTTERGGGGLREAPDHLMEMVPAFALPEKPKAKRVSVHVPPTFIGNNGRVNIYKTNPRVLITESVDTDDGASGAWTKILSVFSKTSQKSTESGNHSRPNSKKHPLGMSTQSSSASIVDKRGSRARRQSSFNSLAAVKRIKKKAVDKQLKSLSEMRQQFVEYFIAQLYLTADLCLDRNYVAIGILEIRLPYTLLLTMLKASYIPNRIKAPVCRILRCLHIDRDPQVPMRLPRLIRTSISLSGGNEAMEAPSCQFALIQQIISDYINNDLDTTKCDELSTEMISLLESLTQFGFYSTSAQLQDVINPLVQVLDDHRAIGVMMTAADREVNAKTAPPVAGSASNSVEAVHGTRNFSMPVDLDDEDDPARTLSSSIQKFQEMGLAKEKKPWFYERWYAEIIDCVEDSEIYDRVVSFLSDSEMDDSPVGLFSSDSDAEDKWEFKLLGMLESMTALYIIISVVITVTVLAMLRLFDVVGESSEYVWFDFLVSGLFIAELTLRMLCFFRVHKNITNFFKNGFNVNDFVIVVFDVVMICVGASLGIDNVEMFAKTLRIVRIIRIFRILRAAKLLSKIVEKASGFSDWTFPTRYFSVAEHEAKTIAGILRVLSLVNLRIQDRQLDTVIQAFVRWYDHEMSSVHLSPTEVYEAVSEERAANNAEPDAFLPPKLDDVLLDIIMYSDPNLTEEALRMLMVHKSQERLLLEATARIQIISTPKMEAKYAELSLLLLKLNRAAEAFEVWGGLETEEDRREAENVSNCLSSVINLTRVQSNPQMLSQDPLFSAEGEVQQLLLNLDAVTTIIQFQYALCDGTLDIPHPDICKLLAKSNELIKWFVVENEENQAAAFKNIDWFMRTIPLGVDSSLAIRSIIWGNKALAKECPRKYISECLMNLSNLESSNPDYLDLLVSVTHISDVGDSGILSIRNEIALHLSHADSSELQWCSGPGSRGYEERKAAMEPFLSKNPPPEDHQLPAPLKYHINYIMLLSGCKLGPKLQAMYQIDDVIAAIIDPSTIYNVKHALGHLLLQIVTTGMNNLDASEAMWLFFEDCCRMFEDSATSLQHLFRRYDRVPLRVQQAEWTQTVISILFNFFSEFSFSNFIDAASFDQEAGSRTTKLSENEAKLVIQRLLASISDFVRKNSALITNHFNESLKNVVDIFATVLEVELVDFGGFHNSMGGRKNIPIRRNSVADEIQQVFYKKQFSTFITGLASTQTSVHRSAVDMFERMPTVHDRVTSDIRLEPFLLKVTDHIRSRVKRFTTSCVLDKSSLESALWVLQTLRLVLERNMGHTVYHIADPHAYAGADNPHVIKLQDTYNDFGVTDMCLDLLAVGIDQSLCIQAAMLLVCLLSRSGSNVNCQKKVFAYLNNNDSTLFFEEVRELIEQQILWCQRDAESKDDRETETLTLAGMPEQVIVLKMISLMCEGNYMPNKNIMREQDGNMRFVNILGSLVEYTKLLSRSETSNCTNAAIRVMKAIVTLLQGPCLGNQEYFVLHSDLLAALNRILRSVPPATARTNEWDFNIELLKEYVVDVLRACIEARPLSSTIIERVESVIESNVLNVIIFSDTSGERKSDLTLLQANYLVFLRTLSPTGTARPAHIKLKTAENIASVEVVWNNAVHRHYFPVPDIAEGISDESKLELLEQVEFSNQEGRLKDFLRRSRRLYREAVHYQGLAYYGLNNAWIVKEKLSWILLSNAIVMNAILVTYYDSTDAVQETQLHVESADIDIAELSEEYTYDTYTSDLGVNYLSGPGGDSSIRIKVLPSEILYWLNVVQICAAAVVLALVVLMRSPVIYKSSMELNAGRISSLSKVLSDPLPLWYCAHTLMAIVALRYNHFILSALLLEFVAIDSATKDVLFTVINPAKQLGVTLILIIILTQIYSCVVFLYYRDQFLSVDCFSMWDSFKIGVSYGARAEEGVGKYMIGAIDNRMILDLMFYYTVCVILRNCFFGLIIDTFGTLRSKKTERETDANDICFICGLDKHEVDKRTSRNSESGFNHHRQDVHYIWNYLFFAMRIWNQPQEDDSGVELHVRKCIMTGDISWLPIGVTGSINDARSDDQATAVTVRSKHDEEFVKEEMSHEDAETKQADSTNGRESRRPTMAPVTMKKRRGSHADGNAESSKSKRISTMYRRLSVINSTLTKLAEARSTPVTSPFHSFNVETNPCVDSNASSEKIQVLIKLSELDVECSNLQRRLSLIAHRRGGIATSGSSPPLQTSPDDPIQPDEKVHLPVGENMNKYVSQLENVPSAAHRPVEDFELTTKNPEDSSPTLSPRFSVKLPAIVEGTPGSVSHKNGSPSVDPAKGAPANPAARNVSAKVLRDMYYRRNSSSDMLNQSFSGKRSLKGPSMKQIEKIVERKSHKKKDEDSKQK